MLRNRNAVNQGARWGLRCRKGGDGAPGGSSSEAGMRAGRLVLSPRWTRRGDKKAGDDSTKQK